MCIDLPKLKEKSHDGRDFVHFVLHWVLEERKEGKEEREAKREMNKTAVIPDTHKMVL